MIEAARYAIVAPLTVIFVTFFVAVIFPPVLIAASAVGMVTGATIGAREAVPKEKWDRAEAVLRDTFADLKIHESLRDRITQIAREQTDHSFVLVEENGPTVPAEEVSYRFLEGKGIDTVLEISVPTVSLEGEGGGNTIVDLSLTVRTRLIRVGDGTVLYVQTLNYRRGNRPFTDWAVKNAEPLREELTRGYKNLAEKIAEEIFLLYLPPGIVK